MYSRQRPRCPDCGEPDESKAQLRTPTSATLRLVIGLFVGGALLLLGGFIATKPGVTIMLMIAAALVIGYTVYLYLRGLG